ncbi:hypothetical protein NK718_04650 [Alsobacter sp. SYSU M60028]|uniref:Transposase n=1 Tax=Alsobacter ponti TaxID=2962936 RepID=A0ABT1L8Q3_9HYPH|nr:hypothetical protein [Alsobacter ponti]MCP8937794.1 hypothetical protein [Alsobacter ponti]
MTKHDFESAPIVEARALYARGVKVSLILEQTGLTPGKFYYWLNKALPEEDEAPAPLPPRRPSLSVSGRLTEPRRAALVGRLWRAAERQVAAIEQRLRAADEDADPAHAPGEREARTLAVLARTVRELSAADIAKATRAREDASRAAAAKARPAVPDDSPQGMDDDDEPPRDLDRFREELARRLQRLRERAGDAGAGGDASPG